MKLVIIGGVAGGASAAARARRISESADILLVERGPDVSFANCGLPYHIGGVIAERDKLLVTTPDELRRRFRIDVRVRTEAEAIDRARRVVRLRDLATGRTVEEPYDRIILAPGAAPIRPPVPGGDLPGVFTLRNLGDTDRIKAAVDAGARRAVVVGAGFIGIELAENLLHRGVKVTVLDLARQILAPFDAEMTTPMAEALAARGVEVLLGRTVESIVPATGGGLDVRMTGGAGSRPADLVILGIGVRPENKLAAEAGLDIGPRGGIRVDDRLRTGDPHIFAVGDAIETEDSVTGDRTQVPLAGPANRQGRIAADNALGRNSRWRGVQGSAILGFFGTTAAQTGATEKTLRRLGRAYRKVYVHATHHAGYHPGAEMLTLKVLFDPHTGQVLGAAGTGGPGVDKRIDVLSVAVQAGMSVTNLEQMELCYAPQYGSAKDPVNMAGFVAGGLMRGDHPQIDCEELRGPAGAGGRFVLDVRTAREFAAGHIPGAVNIPVDELRERLAEVPRDRPVVAYCQVGKRGYLATRILLAAGFEAVNLGGGWKTWEMHRPHAAAG